MRAFVQGHFLMLMFLLMGAVLQPCGGFAAEPLHDDAVLQRLVAAHGQHSTAQGTLTWLTRNTADLAAPTRQQNVQFFLVFPDHYHVIITKPGDNEWKQRFVSDGKNRWEVQQLFANERPDIKKMPVGKDDALEQQLMACFGFNIERLRKDFSLLAYTLADGTHQVILTPITPALTQQLTSLTMDFKADLTLIRIISDDPQGNRFEFQVKEVICDKPLDPALFTLEP
jgi:hypothetical protein